MTLLELMNLVKEGRIRPEDAAAALERSRYTANTFVMQMTGPASLLPVPLKYGGREDNYDRDHWW